MCFVHMRATPEIMSETMARFPIGILSNTPELQGMIDRKTGIVQATFHKPGRLSLPDGKPLAEAREPAHLMLRPLENNKVRMVVADPLAPATRDLAKMTDTLSIRVALPKGSRVFKIDMPGKGEPLDLWRGAPVVLEVE